MKTTVDIADELLAAAKELAREEGTTLKALIEEGLRGIRTARENRRFKLRSASVSGNGLQSGIVEGDWDSIRERAYEGRGT